MTKPSRKQRLSVYLDPAVMKTDLQARSKDRAIEELLDLMCAYYGLKNRRALRQAVFEREALMKQLLSNLQATPLNHL